MGFFFSAALFCEKQPVNCLNQTKIASVVVSLAGPHFERGSVIGFSASFYM